MTEINDNTKLIYGKNSLENIVSIEVKDDLIEVFQEKEDGAVEVLILPNKYWILSPRPIDKNNWVRLKGNLHYKYGLQFSTRKDFLSARGRYRKRDIFSIFDPKESAMVKDGLTYFKGMEPSDVSVLSFDIEASGLLNDTTPNTFMITNTFRRRGVITKKMFSVDEYNNDEYLMLMEWCAWVREINPSVMVGHNIYGYDFPYLQKCADKYNYTLELGRDGSDVKFNHYTSNYRVDGSQVWTFNECYIYGRNIVDTMFLSVKYDIGRDFPSWGLKPIMSHLHKKYPDKEFLKSDRQFYDAGTIRDNWKDPVEREKIKQYGKDDADDSLALYDYMIPSFFFVTQNVPKSFQRIINSATGSWINSFMLRSYVQDKHSIPKTSERDMTVNGGMSYGIPGIYNNVTKWDADSYYPLTMLKFGIHPTGKDPNGNFLKMLQYFTDTRFKQKRLFKETGNKTYDDMQGSSKIFINSSYGMMGASGLNFNSFPDAAKVTRCCRNGLQKAIIWATTRDVYSWWPAYAETTTCMDDFKDFKYTDTKAAVKFEEMSNNNWTLVNIDTDSLSFAKDDGSEFSKDELNKINEGLNDIMYSNWGDDGYFERAVIFKAKNYCLQPKGTTEIKIKGSSLTDSKREPALLELLNRSIKALFFNTEEIKDIYLSYIEELRNREDLDISRWVTKKSITKAVLTNTRSNEKNIRDAFNGRTFSEGEKIFTYFSGTAKDKKIKLKDDYEKDYVLKHYFKRVYDTASIMKNIIELDNIPKIYTNKGYKEYQEELNEEMVS